MTTTVAVLGTGIMGAGMARNLAAAGLDVTVWNRSAEKARPLAEAGARVAEDPASAVAGADVVLTMLFDADAVEQVMGPVLPAVPDGAVWAQSATVGLDAAIRLAGLAAEHGVGFVDAPVLGTRQPAEQGTLVVLAGGPARLRDALAPVFDAIGSRTVWVGERPGDGHRLKLAANSWVLSVVGATAQAVSLTRDLGLDPQQFFDTIAGGSLDCAYAQLKGRAMIEGKFPPAFPLDGAAKDSALIAEAMRGAGTDERVMEALHDRFAAAAEAGHGEEDMAAVVHAMRAQRS
jgi:3-hydroxyisobutyrate dehydrogenase